MKEQGWHHYVAWIRSMEAGSSASFALKSSSSSSEKVGSVTRAISHHSSARLNDGPRSGNGVSGSGGARPSCSAAASVKLWRAESNARSADAKSAADAQEFTVSVPIPFDAAGKVFDSEQ